MNAGSLMNYAPGTEPPVYGPSACVYNGVQVLEMPEDIIWYVVDKFAEAAKAVKECGFGMVTVHAGHGWLLNQFMDPRNNKRTDKWGGSIENRARFTVEVPTLYTDYVAQDSLGGADAIPPIPAVTALKKNWVCPATDGTRI